RFSSVVPACLAGRPGNLESPGPRPILRATNYSRSPRSGSGGIGRGGVDMRDDVSTKVFGPVEGRVGLLQEQVSASCLAQTQSGDAGADGHLFERSVANMWNRQLFDRPADTFDRHRGGFERLLGQNDQE